MMKKSALAITQNFNVSQTTILLIGNKSENNFKECPDGSDETFCDEILQNFMSTMSA